MDTTKKIRLNKAEAVRTAGQEAEEAEKEAEHATGNQSKLTEMLGDCVSSVTQRDTLRMLAEMDECIKDTTTLPRCR